MVEMSLETLRRYVESMEDNVLVVIDFTELGDEDE